MISSLPKCAFNLLPKELINLLLLCVVLLSTCNLVSSHVSLTFPKARRYDFDFLDNGRTKGPCGMPKGTETTALPAGVQFNVTWHLAYPHRGGFRLELLDPNERLILNLTKPNATDWINDGDVTAQSYPVTLPKSLTCRGCTIRLLRQASEWGDKYTFWSCADVDIIPVTSIITSKNAVCSGNGKFNVSNGKCQCNRFYSGIVCQFLDECWTDEDCGNHGKCIRMNTTYPTRQCFCKVGWFGEKCSKESTIKSTEVDLKNHFHQQLTQGYDLYWRIINETEEIEVVLRVAGKGYASIGWRPQNITAACKAFPLLLDSTAVPIEAINPRNSIPGSLPVQLPPVIPGIRRADNLPVDSSPTFKKIKVSSPGALNKLPRLGADLNSKLYNGTRQPKSSESLLADVSSASPESEPVTPVISSEPVAVSVSSEPEPVPKAEASPEPKPVSTSNNLTDSEPKGEPKVEPEGAPKSNESTVTYAEPEPEPKKETDTSEPKPPVEHSTESPNEPEATNTRDAKSNDQPVPEPEAEVKTSTEPAADLEPTKAEPEVKPEPDSVDNEPKSTDESTVTYSKPEPEVNPTTEPEPKSEAQTEPVTEPEVVPSSPSSTSTTTTTTTASPATNANNDKSSFTAGSYSPVELESEIKIRNKRQAAGTGPGSLSIIGNASPVTKRKAIDGWQKSDYPPVTDYTPKHDFHAMDCNDIIIGSAIGEYGRVLDYYTRDRSTPRVDSLFGGKNDLTGAVAYESDGLTTIIFRKKLIAEELTDHSILNKTMDVIWAKGQEHKKYVHSPPSGLEEGKPSNPNFYGAGEIKYHGHGGQRGRAQINFYQDPVAIEPKTPVKPANVTAVPITTVAEPVAQCNGEYRFPTGCKGRACDYLFTWKYNEDLDAVDFAVSAKRVDKWTGIGFSKDKLMPKTDVIIAWVEPGGRYLMMDAWLEGYTQPKPDFRQSIFNISALAENGLITFKFTRKIETNDLKHDLSLNECVYFVYPVSGGPVDVTRKNIRKHLQPPLFSESPICLSKCRPVGVSTSEPNAVKPISSTSEPGVTPKSESTPTPVSQPEPKPEPKAEPKPESEPKPVSEPTKPEPESEPSPKPEVKPEPEVKTAPKPEPNSEPKAEPKPEPAPEPSSEAVPKIETKYGTVCSGEWKYPENCTGYGCDYQITWEYMDDNDEIMFNLQTKNTNRWTGIGFSNNKLMPHTDVILGLVEESGRFFLMDTWLDGYTSPPLDRKQDIHNSSAWRENGITHLKFFRYRKTNDPKDFEFTDNACPYFVFPIRGGVFNAVNKRIRKHEAVPIISEERVCVRSCKPKPVTVAPVSTSTTTTTTPKPEPDPETEIKSESRPPPLTEAEPKPESEKPVEAKPASIDKVTEKTSESSPSSSTTAVPEQPTTTSTGSSSSTTTDKTVDNEVLPDETMVVLEIKMPNAWKSTLSQKSSSDYRKLMTKLEDQLEKELQDNGQVPKQIEVTDISGVGENGVLATVKVEVANATESRARYDKSTISIREALNETIKDGKVGNLIVDPSYLIFKSPDLYEIVGNPSEAKKAGLSSEQLTYLAIIVGLSSLVILCVSQALCMVWRDKNNKERRMKEKAMVSSHYKDYSATTTSSAYSYENFAVQDDPDGVGYKPMSAKLNGNSKSDSGNKKKGSNGFANYNSATVDRNDLKTSSFGYPSAYATHDRKDNNTFRYISQPQPLTPDYYFMPHQRRYSGEVVRVFVDYNNPQFMPK